MGKGTVQRRRINATPFVAPLGAVMNNETKISVRDHQVEPGIDQPAVRPITALLATEPTVAMVTTMVGRHHSSRPVTCADVQDHRLSFLVSQQAEWVAAIAASQAIVHVTVADDAHTTYLSLNGGAIVVTDPQEILRLWSPAARAWFDRPDDPDLAVVHFDVTDGEYWEGPGGRVGRAVAMLRAALTVDAEVLGTQGLIAGNDVEIDADVARFGNTPDHPLPTPTQEGARHGQGSRSAQGQDQAGRR
jgi:general stress protein 26